MDRRLLTLLCAIGSIGFTGCQSARYVLKEADHGVVAIPSTVTWSVNHREKADILMHQHFPGGYDVVREEEVAVGAETSTHSSESSTILMSILVRGGDATAKCTLTGVSCSLAR